MKGLLAPMGSHFDDARVEAEDRVMRRVARTDTDALLNDLQFASCDALEAGDTAAALLLDQAAQAIFVERARASRAEQVVRFAPHASECIGVISNWTLDECDCWKYELDA